LPGAWYQEGCGKKSLSLYRHERCNPPWNLAILAYLAIGTPEP